MSQIRLLRTDDEPRVLEMMLGLDQEGAGIRPTNPENVHKTFEYLRAFPDRGACAVVESEGRLVGYALVFPFWSAEYGGLLTLLDEIYVVPEQRSRAIGRKLLAWVEAEARRQGHKAVSLVAMNRNVHAKRFYETLGYHAVDATSYDKLL
jgi:GNAT superfamily N-acetyltransferase